MPRSSRHMFARLAQACSYLFAQRCANKGDGRRHATVHVVPAGRGRSDAACQAGRYSRGSKPRRPRRQVAPPAGLPRPGHARCGRATAALASGRLMRHRIRPTSPWRPARGRRRDALAPTSTAAPSSASRLGGGLGGVRPSSVVRRHRDGLRHRLVAATGTDLRSEQALDEIAGHSCVGTPAARPTSATRPRRCSAGSRPDRAQPIGCGPSRVGCMSAPATPPATAR